MKKVIRDLALNNKLPQRMGENKVIVMRSCAEYGYLSGLLLIDHQETWSYLLSRPDQIKITDSGREFAGLEPEPPPEPEPESEVHEDGWFEFIVNNINPTKREKSRHCWRRKTALRLSEGVWTI